MLGWILGSLPYAYTHAWCPGARRSMDFWISNNMPAHSLNTGGVNQHACSVWIAPPAPLDYLLGCLACLDILLDYTLVLLMLCWDYIPV